MYNNIPHYYKGFFNMPLNKLNALYNSYSRYPYPFYTNMPNYSNYVNNLYNAYTSSNCDLENNKELKDYGPEPFVVDIEEVTMKNDNFRTVLWTGDHLQLTLMSIDVGEDIGLEMHPDVDQFLRVEQGQGHVKMGDSKDRLDFNEEVYDDYAFIIPAGKWHNLINTGDVALKVYSIYAPAQHPRGTIHKTKADEEHE